MKIFSNQVAIVTGAGSGIGKELAKELARQGAELAVTDIVPERIDQVVKELKAMGAEAKGYLVDHSDLAKVKDFAEKIFSDWKDLDILCLNAGVGLGGKIEQHTIEDWEWIIGNNLWSVIYMLQVFLPKMIERQAGKILITASGAGLIGIPGTAPYCTTKFALVGLAETLRAELSKHRINVSVLCPGVIKTNIVRDSRIYLQDDSGGSVKPKAEEFFRRFGTGPEKVARAGIRALKRNRGVQLSPLNVWTAWILKRLSPALYQYLAGLIWRKGWLV